MLRFVKLVAYYWLDEKVAAGDDAAEVMFTRGMSYCAGSATGGRIPTAIVPTLTRRPASATRVARGLVERGLWTPVADGFQITAWDHHNDALDALEARRRSDRERQSRSRKNRASNPTREPVTGHVTSRDSHADVTTPEIEEEVDAAAAAPGAAAAADLHPVLAVLRSKLQEHTPLRALRFDTLSDDQVTELVALVETQGDAHLVRVARDTCRTPPPVHVSAFIKTWAALPPPGRRLHAVPTPPPSSNRGQASPEAIAAARATAFARPHQEDECP